MATPTKASARPPARPTPPARPAPKAATPAPKPAPARPGPPAARPAAAAPAARPVQAAQPVRATPPAVRKAAPVAQIPNAENLPAHIRAAAEQGLARGSENVDMQDMVIPRIELVQALSPCIDPSKPEYIEGAQAGMFFNSVTRELFGASVIVCPVYFRKQWLVWKDRKSGGGFGGAYDSQQEAVDRCAQEQDADLWEATETAQQIVLIVNQETGETSEAVVSMARTKLKVSRQWNSLIRINGFDRFSRLYELFGVDETNSQNQGYKNLGVRYIDFANVEVYKKAEELYNSIAEGSRKVVLDDKYDEDAIEGEATAAGAASVDEAATPEY